MGELIQFAEARKRFVCRSCDKPVSRKNPSLYEIAPDGSGLIAHASCILLWQLTGRFKKDSPSSAS